MLTPQQCRKIDPAFSQATDAELEAVMTMLYGLGHLVFDVWKSEINSVSKNPFGVQIDVGAMVE